METITISVEPRADSMTVRALRRAGRVPAIFYGRGLKSVSVSVEGHELTLKLGNLKRSQLIRLKSNAGELDGKTVLLKEVQIHPSRRSILHADFYAVDLNRAIRVRVPLHYVGKPEGVTAGGILQPLRRDVMVECLPVAIPAAVEVDVSTLAIHDTIHIEDVAIPAGVVAVAETNFALVTVLPPTVEVVTEPTPEAAEIAEGAAEQPREPAGEAKEEQA